ncbi:MAG: cyclase family protein [Planctomycetaceae bacterium]|nr:cyclase family protein [Planctomycetaceae bacterium]
MTRAIIDISPRITPDIAVWPGDTPLSREVLCHLEQGASVTLSTLRATVHLGAHADGANHYGAGAGCIDTMPLERYLGPCQVVRARADRRPGGMRVGVAHLETPLDAIRQPRVLIRTGTFPDFTAWNSDFAGLEPALVDALADRGVLLVGVDTPSVDVQESKDLAAHQRFLARNVSIIEGLRLDHVVPGEYELIALPLPLVGFDASPVRAVLRSLA